MKGEKVKKKEELKSIKTVKGRSESNVRGRKKTIIDEGDYMPVAVIDCSDPWTYAVLLKTEDITAIIQGCEFIYAFILKNHEYGEYLTQKGIVEDLLNSLTDNYPYYKATRFRLLSKLYELYPQTRPKIKARVDFLKMAIRDAVETRYLPLRDYALLYFYWVSKRFTEIIDELIEIYGVNLFFTKFLPDPDVDVKHNALGVMTNLLDYEYAIWALIDADNFSFTDLVDQCSCPYPAIQNRALDIIIELTRRTEKEEFVHKKFVKAGGFEILLQLLNVFQWRDIHAKVFKIFRILFHNPSNLNKFQKLDGVLRLFNYVHYILDDDLMEEDLQTILSFASTFEGKLLLTKEDVLDVFFDVLNDGSEEAKLLSCNGIRLFTEDTEGMLKMIERGALMRLNKILLNEENSVELRCCCAFTLSKLIKSATIPKLMASIPRFFSGLVKVLRQPLELTTDCVCTLMEAISALLCSPVKLNRILSLDFTKNLIALLELDDPEKIKITQYAAEILTWTLSRRVGRIWFIGQSGVIRVMKLLYSSTDPTLLNNIGLLLRMVVEKDPVLADDFIMSGLVQWLVDSRNLWAESPRLETATKFFFQHNLSLKLEYWGRLETTDIIADGFYCCRFERKHHFPLMPEISRKDICLLRPAYLVSFGGELFRQKEDSISLLAFDCKHKQRKLNDVRGQRLHPTSQPSKCANLSVYSRGLIDSAKRKKSLAFENDINLRRLYEDIKKQISELPTGLQSLSHKFEKQWVQERAEVIGKCIDKALSAKYSKDDCTFHTFELHIQELKMKLNTSLIPLGELKVGLKLERALFFKVLADRVGLPCALARGYYSVGWVEVAAYPPRIEPFKDLPLENLTTNYLVDLISEPGKLVALSSMWAANYCGQPLPGVLDHLPRHMPECKPAWMSYKKGEPEEVDKHVEIQ